MLDATDPLQRGGVPPAMPTLVYLEIAQHVPVLLSTIATNTEYSNPFLYLWVALVEGGADHKKRLCFYDWPPPTPRLGAVERENMSVRKSHARLYHLG